MRINTISDLYQIRYRDDVQDREPANRPQSGIGLQKRQLLSTGLNITESLLPGPYEILVECANILKIDMDRVEGCVYSQPDNNAWCLSEGTDHILIAISSSLIKILKPNELAFVIGHELGHAVFKHSDSIHLDSQESDFQGQTEIRAKEISADRTGLLCSGSLESSVYAMMKLASGLDDDTLNMNVAAFIDQCNKLEGLPVGPADRYATHPPPQVRAKALIRFSLSKVFNQSLVDQSAIERDIKEIDQEIADDTSKYIDRGFEQEFEEHKHYFKLFFSALHFSIDGNLSKEEQDFLKKTCGDATYNKLINLLKGLDTPEVIQLLTSKSKYEFQNMSLFSREKARQFLMSCAKEIGSSDQDFSVYE